MTTNRSAPPGSVVPVLKYEDVGAAIDWLCSVFGFREKLRAASPRRVEHAQLIIGTGGVILSAIRYGDDADPAEVPARGQVRSYVHVAVDDVDAHYARVKASGARITNDVDQYEFGERQYGVEDLEGHHWVFSQSIADVDPRSWATDVNDA